MSSTFGVADTQPSPPSRKQRRAAAVKAFFSRSGTLDHDTLRPLSHIRFNWELTWCRETQAWRAEDDSFAGDLNRLIDDLARTSPPARYHDHEDRLAERVIANLGWPIRKENGRWIGEDYDAISEQGGFDDIDQHDLLLAAAGRIRTALDRGQLEYDDMESGHRLILGAVLAVILYHRF
jgi:hypothetical protein